MSKKTQDNEQFSTTLWYMGLATVFTAFLILYVIVLTRNELAQHQFIGKTDKQNYTISISGKGEVTAVPDIAEISFGVETEKLTVLEAQQENNKKINAVTEMLKENNIDTKDISTSEYSITPRYNYTEEEGQVLVGYVVSSLLRVKVRAVEQSGSIIDQAGKLGVNRVGGLTFTIDEPEALQQQARLEALKNARQKAEDLAAAAGVRLGRIVSFEEQSSEPPVYPVASRGIMMDAVEEKAAPPDIQAGVQEVIVTVNVEYEVL